MHKKSPTGAIDSLQGVRALRLFVGSMLFQAFEQIHAAVKTDWTITSSPQAWSDAVDAYQWFTADDQAHPLSYRHCCELLGLSPARGLKWAWPYLRVIDRGMMDRGTQRSCLSGRGGAASTADMKKRIRRELASRASGAAAPGGPVVCGRCGRIIAASRPAWTWGLGDALRCEGCRRGGDPIPVGGSWRLATDEERQRGRLPLGNPPDRSREDDGAEGEDRRLRLTAKEEARVKEILGGRYSFRATMESIRWGHSGKRRGRPPGRRKEG